MTAKEYVEQAWIIERRIRTAEIEMQSMRDALHGRSSAAGSSGGSRTDKALEKAICRVIDKEREIDREIAFLISAKEEIARTIRQVPNLRLREILVRRYLRFQKWERIAADMGLEVRYTFKLHGYALLAVDDILKKNTPGGH